MDNLIGKTIGPYRILEQIGVGGMATVFKAYHPALDRNVAVKILPAHLAADPTFFERFRREARAVASLEHPHILPVYDFGQEGNLSYLVMRCVPAGTLKQVLGKPLVLARAVNFVTQIAGALDHAHEKGIIHRDVKPSNVLLDHGDWALLTDFGVARMMEGTQQLTATGVGIGTPAYMSPEQGMGKRADRRSDVYSLGVMLYEMLVGRVPFEAETPMAVLFKHVHDPLPLPRKLNPGISEAVERVVLKAMAKDPIHRFQTAGELAMALEAASKTTRISLRQAAESEQGPLAFPRLWSARAFRAAAILVGCAALVGLGIAAERSGLIGGTRSTATPATPAPTKLPTARPALLPTVTPVEADVLKIGVLGPFSGPVAWTGGEIKDAAVMAFEEIDNSIGPYEIELVFIDSQSDPEKAKLAYEEAIVQDGIQAGLLGWHSSVAVALMEVTAKHRIPHFFSMGETDVINDMWRSDPERYGYWVKGWPAPRALVSKNYADGFADMIAEGIWKPASKKIAIASEETDWGRAVAEPLAELMTEAGWAVVGPDYFPVEEGEFHPLLTAYKAAGVSATVVTDTSRAGVAAFIKQAREVRLPGLLVMHGLGWFEEWYNLIGDASDGVLDQIPQLAKPEALEWANRFEVRWSFRPSAAAAGLSYDWTNVLIRILQETYQECGRLTSETIYQFGREKLWTGEFTYSDGIIMPMYRFTPASIPDPVVGKEAFAFPILQYEGGESKIIWPLDWAQAPLKVP